MQARVNRSEIVSPMFISSRLMAAVKVDGSDGGVLHVEWSGKSDSAGRAKVHYIVEATDGTVLADSDDLAVHRGYADAMESLCAFLGASAESYSYALHTARTRGISLEAALADSENGTLFPPACVEWAYRNDDELSMIAEELREQLEGAQ